MNVVETRNPVEETITSIIPVIMRDLCLYFTLNSPIISDTTIPVRDEIVRSCPIIPMGLLNVSAISINNRLDTMLGIWREKLLDAREIIIILVEYFLKSLLNLIHPTKLLIVKVK